MPNSSEQSFSQQAQRLLRRRWLVWAMLAFSFAIVFFHRVSLSVVADHLMAEFDLGAAALGNLGAVYFYIYTVMQIPSGILADTSGPRLTVTVGMLLASLGAAVFALAPNLAVATVGRFLTGLGVSVVFVSVQKAQTYWFRPREFGTITGLTSVVGNSGAILGAAPLAYLVTAVGWRHSFKIISIVGALAGVGCWLLVHDRPENLGLPSIAQLEAKEAGVAVQTPPKPRKIPFRQSLQYVLQNRYTLPLMVAAFGFNGALQSLISMWGTPYLMQVYGLTRAEAAVYPVITGIGTIIAGFLSGLISDRFKCRRGTMLGFGAMPLVAWSMLALCPVKINLDLLKAAFFMAGLGTGAYLMLMVMTKEVNPPSISGLATGTINSGSFLGVALVQLLVGVILEATWDGVVENNIPVYSLSSFRWGFRLCLLAVVMAYLTALRLPETRARNLFTDDDLPAEHPTAALGQQG